ncbi:hypothetical protein SDC9_111108 [bioreactor metagenome]|uniref:DUF4884 domain-containing protein n=2 Tax=root TaxID=1 RepID=A0A645BFW6_9ZZZZ|nr:DUF4884 domain-containing protein [Porphyromonadaceae bacterium]HCA99370.1 DUF4884 domain-containing protein [Porphyromonadaceae bacterium]
MKTFVKILMLIALTSVMYCCSSLYRLPVSTEIPVNNQSYQVDYLFEHDGCKVYRFYDRGQYVYFTNCQGEVTSIKNDSTAARVTNSVRITYDDYDKTRKN